MPRYQYKPAVEAYGHVVGILLLDPRVPYAPGDSGNAETFRFPVMHRTVSGLTPQQCLDDPSAWTEQVVAQAQALEAQGVRSVTAAPGVMLAFQDAVRDALEVPVYLSSLLQIPWIAAALDPSRPVGLIVGCDVWITHAFLRERGISPTNPIGIRGMQDRPEFRAAVLEEKGTLDSDRLEAETVDAARALVSEHPEVGAVVLEPAQLSPYAPAVQTATGLPVFDHLSLIDYVRSATHQERAVGYY